MKQLLGLVLLASAAQAGTPVATTPEPGFIGVLGVGIAAIGVFQWKRRKNSQAKKD